MDVILSGRRTEPRLVQALKADSPILVTESGMEMLVNPVHRAKAEAPILVTEFGMEMLVKDVHLSKAQESMVVTPKFSTTLFKLLH